jgi:hypothetical protein
MRRTRKRRIEGLVQPPLFGVTRLFWAKHTLSRELASQADSSQGLATLESLRITTHQLLFSLIAANTEMREK